MSLKSQLQKELNETNYITRKRLYQLAEKFECDFDTLRNYLEPTKGMGTYKVHNESKKIIGWRKVSVPITHNKQGKIEELKQTGMFGAEPQKKVKQFYEHNL